MPVVGNQNQYVYADASSPLTLSNVAGDTLFYGDQYVSSGSNLGSLSQGQSVALAQGVYVVSAGSSRYETKASTAQAATTTSTTATGVVRAGVGGGLPIIASHNADSSSTVTTVGGSTNDTHQSRLKHTVGTKDIVGVALAYINWHNETAGANAITVSASIESPAATFYPVTFDGADTTVIAPDGYRVSDPVPLDLAAAGSFFSRTRVTFTAGATAPVTRTTVVADGEGSETGAALTSKLATGTFTAAVTYAYAPALVLGIAKDGSVVRSIALLGDSIMNGQTDYTFDKSYGTRACEAAGVGCINLAVNGEAATTYAAPATSRRRRLLSGALDTVIPAYGTNDVIGATTLPVLQARMLTIAFAHRNRGARVFLPTLMPLSDSTDGFITLANQTPRAVNTVRVAYNNWLRDGSPIDPVSFVAVATGAQNALRAGDTGHPLGKVASHPTLAKGYIELADVVESSRDSGKWAVTGASGTGSTTSGGNTITSFAGTGFAVGQVLVAAGVPNGGFPNGYPVIDSGVGTGTLTLKGVSGTNTNANATAAGVAIASALTGDGTHAWPAAHLMLAAAFPAAALAT